MELLRPRNHTMNEVSKEQGEPQNWLGYQEQEQEEVVDQLLGEALDFIENDHQLKNNNSNGNSNSTPANKRKRLRWNNNYHRHTDDQIHQMEEIFKECQHPNEMMQRDLSKKIGLKPLQIKFWFQNKRTQVKNQSQKKDNERLRAENERLRLENNRCKEALKGGAVCPTCSTFMANPPIKTQLLMENNKLKQEIMRLSAIAAQYNGKPIGSSSSSPGAGQQGVVGDQVIMAAVGSYRQMIADQVAGFVADEVNDIKDGRGARLVKKFMFGSFANK